MRELANSLGTYTSAAYQHVLALVRKGYVRVEGDRWEARRYKAI
jgi:hypothetical protein